MKIAILSMQRVVNYGSFMQSFALRKTIESLGHECEYLDITPGVQLKGLERSKTLYFKKFVERFLNINFFKIYKQHRKLNSKFKSEFFEELGLNKKKYDSYDIAVIGSDEVFHFAQPTPWGFTKQLYGSIPEASKVISYAGSFSNTRISDIKQYNLESEISNSMSKMSSISVRDKNSVKVVNELLGVNPVMNVDPVFIYDFSQHLIDIDENNYILIYTYPNRISGRDEIDEIVRFAKKHKKKLISIGFYFSWCDEVVTPHPFEVLSYVKNADFVITDTFHGSIFSIITNQKFATLIRKSNNEKLSSLLDTMDKSDRIVNDIHMLENVLTSPIDYDNTNKIISVEKERSLDYLKANLS